MAAEISLVASAVGIVGFVGQITQGCVYLNGIIGDLKDAPEEIRGLRNDLDIINTAADSLRTMHERRSQSGTLPTTTDPVHALKQCDAAVAALTALLKPSLDAFDDGSTTKTASARRSWHRLKRALGKEKTREKLETLTRAKLSLLAVQSNMELELLDHLAKSDRNLSQSIFKLRESSATTNHNLYKLERDINTSTKTVNETQQKAENIVSEVSSVKMTLRQVSMDTNDTAACVRRLEDCNHHLPDLISASATAVMDDNQALTSDVLQRIDAGFSTQMDAQGQGQSLMLARMAQLIDAAFEKERGNQDSVIRGGSKTTVESPNSRISDPSRTIGSDRKYKIVSTTTFRTYICSIIIQDLELRRSVADDNNTAPIFLRRLEVQMKLGFLNRSFQLTQTRRRYDPGSEMSLRTRNIVSRNGPATRAVRSWDLTTIREMFENGQASPFDVTEYGTNYLSECLVETIWLKYPRKQKLQELDAMVAYFIDSGMKWEELYGPWGRLVIENDENTSSHEELALQSIIRKILPNMPYLYEDNTLHYDQQLAAGAVGQLIIQHGYSMTKAHSCEYDDYNTLLENDRTMLHDPYGRQLEQFLMDDKGSKELLYYICTRVCLSHDDEPGPGLCSLLHSYSKDRSPELRFCCLNRLVQLLQHGWDPRRSEWAIVPYHQILRKKMSISEVAVLYDTLELWQEALSINRWSAFEIMSLLDEDIYRGIPELMNGEVYYITVEEWWDEIKAGWCSGKRDLDEEKEFESCFWGPNRHAINNEFRDAINISRDIFSQRDNRIPGDWPTEEEWTIRPSDKALLDQAIIKVEQYLRFTLHQNEDEDDQYWDSQDEASADESVTEADSD